MSFFRKTKREKEGEGEIYIELIIFQLHFPGLELHVSCILFFKDNLGCSFYERKMFFNFLGLSAGFMPGDATIYV